VPLALGRGQYPAAARTTLAGGRATPLAALFVIWNNKKGAATVKPTAIVLLLAVAACSQSKGPDLAACQNEAVKLYPNWRENNGLWLATWATSHTAAWKQRATWGMPVLLAEDGRVKSWKIAIESCGLGND
jgi:hypothetical protein